MFARNKEVGVRLLQRLLYQFPPPADADLSRFLCILFVVCFFRISLVVAQIEEATYKLHRCGSHLITMSSYN